MRKVVFYNSLRFPYARPRASAFTLTELIVSVGILIVMLSVAGQVMTLTIRSTGQSKALTEVNQQLRVIYRMLREDLRNVDRARSVMVIEGNPIDAYWTQDGKDADENPNPTNGYPHTVDPEREDPFAPGVLGRPRADVLMFFTNRRATSNVFPTVVSDVQQVVYGHADLGTYARGVAPPIQESDFTEDTDAFPLTTANADSPQTSPLPAERWVLARRRVLLLPNNPQTPLFEPVLTALDDPRMLRGQADVFSRFVYDDQVLTPGAVAPRFWPAILQGLEGNAGDEVTQQINPLERSQLDPLPPPTLPNALNHYLLPRCASFKVEWALDPHSDFVGGLLDRTSQVYWIDPGILGDPENPGLPPNPLQTLEDAALDLGLIATGVAGDIQRLLGDVRGGFGLDAYSLRQRFGGIDFISWFPPLQQQTRRPNLAVFTANRLRKTNPNAAGEIVPEDIFPRALRITIDVFDRARRLDRPIRHVMVIPVGAS